MIEKGNQHGICLIIINIIIILNGSNKPKMFKFWAFILKTRGLSTNLQDILNNVNVNDVINEVNNLGIDIDQDQINNLIGNELQNLLQSDQNPLSNLLDANNLLPLINNLTQLNLNEQSLLPILNSLMNQNATGLSQIFHNLLDNPQIKDILNDPSVQQSILNIINNPESVSTKDLLKILIGVLNSTEMEEVLRKHLVVYIPDLASKLLQANSTDQVLAILEPIVSFHVNYYLKQLNLSGQVESFLNNLNPAYAQLINNFFYTNTLDYKDLLNLLQPLVNSYIPDKNLADHLFIYLPDLLQRLSNAKTPDDFYQIAEYLLVSHFGNLETNLTKLILDNQFLNGLAQFKSVQDLLTKLSTSGMENLKISDLVNIYLEYMNMPALTESQLNHLNIYIPDLINQLQSNNSSDLMSILEPIISFHLNYYLNVNPQPLQNLINSLINQSSWATSLLELADNLNLDSALNLTDWQAKHLFVYLPEFVYNLTQVKSYDLLIELIKPIAMQHLSLLAPQDPNQDIASIVLENLLGSAFLQNSSLLNLQSVQELLLKLATGEASNLKISDLVNIYLEYMNMPSLTESQLNHLNIYIPDLINQLQSSNSSDLMSILEPIISFHLNYYLNVNPQPLQNLINSLINQSSWATSLLELADNLNLDSALNLTDWQAKHLFVYLPEFVYNLTQVKSYDQLIELIKPIAMQHLSLLAPQDPNQDIASIVLENLLGSAFLQNSSLLNLQSVQELLLKLATGEASNLKISDLVNIYLEYMNMPALTESQLNHLNIYIPDLINQLQSSNTSDLMSILEPIISFHLNYYLNVNPQPLQNLINSLVSNNPAISDLVNSLSNIQSALNLSQSEYNHLFVYIPEFLYNLTKAKDNTEIMNLIQQVLVVHLNYQNGSVLSLLDELLSDFSMSTLNTTVEPLFNTPEFVLLIKDLLQVYTNGASLNQSKLIQDALMVMAPPLMNSMKMAIYQMSPEIYEFAKDQSDPRVVVAYAVHAGESVLHDNLRAFGIPYDSVYLGATTTSVMTTTTQRRVIDVDLLNQIINLNKDKNDINNFLGNSGGDKPLIPFEPDNNGGDGGGFDYF
ncbi:hypothetical protein BpHYR1_031610 [Brachionus plicatilis]|uniref:Uncharacterized protein n=1 Tax=Brachionus plicatilis TaxID=10195 RepID=A0A3M7SI38_BRAPC|nr:hypothetical protein BpHYR1_031610 [Brachionus plicatilis]